MSAFEDFVYAEMPLRPVMIRGATDATGDPNSSVVAKVNAAPAGTFYLQDDVTPKDLWRKVGSGSTDWLLLSGVHTTTEDITYYVRSGGDDSNDGLTVGTALATIQEAVDRTPKLIRHSVKIDVGEGTFTGFYVEGFDCIGAAGTFLVEGTLGNPTLTTGTTSGTATSGTTTSKLVDSGQSWTVNELRGMFLLVDGQYRVIYKNTNTEVYIHQVRSGMKAGSTYEIVVPTSVIDTGEPVIGYGILSRNCTWTNRTDLTFRNFQVEGTYGVSLQSTYGGKFERLRLIGTVYGMYFIYTYIRWDAATIYTSGGYYGALLLSGRGEHLHDFYSYNAILSGMFGGWTDYFNIEAVAVSDSQSNGIEFQKSPYLDMRQVLVENCAGFGLVVDYAPGDDMGGLSYLTSELSLEMNDNGNDGLRLGNNAVARVKTLTGSGNAGYGVNLQNGSKLLFDGGSTDLTGSSGNVTINGGSTVLVWATDFASDGDSAVNLANGCRIKRQDR